jgi:hypothetical protein
MRKFSRLEHSLWTQASQLLFCIKHTNFCSRFQITTETYRDKITIECATIVCFFRSPNPQITLCTSRPCRYTNNSVLLSVCHDPSTALERCDNAATVTQPLGSLSAYTRRCNTAFGPCSALTRGDNASRDTHARTHTSLDSRRLCMHACLSCCVCCAPLSVLTGPRVARLTR